MQKLYRQYGLLVWLLLLLVAGFCAVLFTSYSIPRDTLQRGLIEQTLPLTGERAYAEIQKDFVRPVTLTAQIAKNTFVRDWLINGEQDGAAIGKYLKEIKSGSGAIAVFLASDLTQQQYSANGTQKALNPNDMRDQWFFKAKNLKAPHEINVTQDASNRENMTLTVSQRILDESGKVIAVAGISVAFDTIKRLIDSDQTRLHRNLYFVDGKGNIVLAAATAKRLNILKSPGISAIAPHILSNKKSEAQALEYKTETGNTLLNARFIPELGWYLLVEQDLGSAVKPLQDMLMMNAAIGGFITLIILIMLTVVVRRYQSRLEKSAATDQLTTLMNRQAFDFVFANALLDSERSRQPMCVALIDIDFFKKMNDKHGHLVGDHVLREIAMISKRSLRESDVICRWGGEEFLILLKNCTLEKATSIAENLRATIAANDFSRTTDLARKRLSVTVSMGVAECKDKETEDSVFERADVALSQAKESGRNSVYFAE